MTVNVFLFVVKVLYNHRHIYLSLTQAHIHIETPVPCAGSNWGFSVLLMDTSACGMFQDNPFYLLSHCHPLQHCNTSYNLFYNQCEFWLCISYCEHICRSLSVHVNTFVCFFLHSRLRFCTTTVCPPVRAPVSWRRPGPQAPEQNTLRTPTTEHPRPSHTSAPATAQHANTGEAQTANSPGQGMNKISSCI